MDHTGRRRRVVKLAGGALGAVLLAGLVSLIVGLSGGPTLHLPGFSDQGPPADGAGSAQHGPADGAANNPTTATTAPATSAVPGANGSAATTPTTTSPRRIPTQTPSHKPKPT